MTKIKLCGMCREADIEAANALLPNFVGFILTGGFRRSVTRKQARRLKSKLDCRIRAVGVFVNESVEYVASFVQEKCIDAVQLHGAETEEYIQALRKRVNVPVWQAFKIAKAEDCERVAKSRADLVLVDSGQGTGKPFDWALLQGVAREYFLAGGLQAENVQAALRQVAPYGVDVSSGIETDGKKDPEKMKKFVNAVKEFDGGEIF